MTFFKHKFGRAKNIVSDNKKVVENYFLMTSLQVVGSFIGLLVFPYVIRALGAEAYGLFVFANSVAAYFIIFISFGFTTPALKAISQNADNLEIKNDVVSTIFTAKVYISLVVMLIYACLLFFVPFFRQNIFLFLICFSLIIPEIFFPQWYFQGIQKMRIVTYIHLFFRLLTIPFIFIFVKNPADLHIYAIIVTSASVLGALVCAVYMKTKENITLRFVPFRKLKAYFKSALPFFLSNSAGTIKEESATLLIGVFFNMRDVALYDLARKIILIPRMFTANINKAIFPKFIKDVRSKESVRKLIKYEALLGFLIMVLIAVFGYWIVLFMGGKDMLLSYPLAVILSFTIVAWLVVGCYNHYVFIPIEKYYYITRNQTVGLVSFFVFCIPALFVFNSVYPVVSSLALSGLFQILYCKHIAKKNNYL